MLQVLLGEPIADVWAAAVATLHRGKSVLGQLTRQSATTRQRPIPQVLVLSGPGLLQHDAAVLIRQQATKPAATAGLSGKRSKGMRVWAWLYSGTDGRTGAAAAAAAALAYTREDGQPGSLPVDHSTQHPLPGSRRRTRRRTGRAQQTGGSGSSSTGSSSGGGYSRAADAVLVLSCQPLPAELPQQHPQWGELLQHQQLQPEWQAISIGCSSTQLLHQTSATSPQRSAAADGSDSVIDAQLLQSRDTVGEQQPAATANAAAAAAAKAVSSSATSWSAPLRLAEHTAPHVTMSPAAARRQFCSTARAESGATAASSACNDCQLTRPTLCGSSAAAPLASPAAVEQQGNRRLLFGQHPAMGQD